MTEDKQPDINKLFGDNLPYIFFMVFEQFDPIWAFEEHATDRCEMLHILSGDMELITQDYSIKAHAGDTLIIPPGKLHRDQFDVTQDLEIFQIHFSWSKASEYFRRVNITAPFGLSNKYKSDVAFLFDGLRGDIRGATAEDRLTARARLLMILMLIMRGTCKTADAINKEGDSPATTKARHDVLIDNAKQYIQNNFTKMISLDDIAMHLKVSTYHLSHVFSKETEFTVYKYLILLRMKKAKALLSEGKLNVSEVGFAVGYNNPAYFSKIFNKHFGCLPSEIS